MTRWKARRGWCAAVVMVAGLGCRSAPATVDAAPTASSPATNVARSTTTTTGAPIVGPIDVATVAPGTAVMVVADARIVFELTECSATPYDIDLSSAGAAMPPGFGKMLHNEVSADGRGTGAHAAATLQALSGWTDTTVDELTASITVDLGGPDGKTVEQWLAVRNMMQADKRVVHDLGDPTRSTNTPLLEGDGRVIRAHGMFEHVVPGAGGLQPERRPEEGWLVAVCGPAVPSSAVSTTTQ